MNIFDLLFILVFLTSAGTLLWAAVLAMRGRGARALALLRRFAICAAVYFGIVILASVFWPRTVLQTGERHCFDDWCIAVESASHQPAGDRVAYTVHLQLSSTARGVTQRERNMVVYLVDDRGRRYDPLRNASDTPLDTPLAPGESVAATRTFEAPTDARDPGLVMTHQGGFPIGWFIIGYETWFHKPAIVRLP